MTCIISATLNNSNGSFVQPLGVWPLGPKIIQKSIVQELLLHCKRWKHKTMCISNTLRVICAQGFGIAINALKTEIWAKMYFVISRYSDLKNINIS